MRQLLILLLLLHGLCAPAQKSIPLTIEYTPGRPANRFQTNESIGAAFDGHWGGETGKLFQPAIIDTMRSAGLRPISYRLRTELGDEAWHWNPEGIWSDPQQQQGYWTSSEKTTTPIDLSFGYCLPRRGNTHDNANDNGYSRIDDGDTNTFWKSNPYLDQRYTGESDSLHPQWVVIDLGRSMDVNALRILWGQPAATWYRLDYAGDIGDAYFEPYQPGLWHPLQQHVNRSGDRPFVFANKPLRLRFLRITMTRSDHAATGSDPRDCLGFAIREIGLGLLDEKGIFHDLVRHRADGEQSVIRVSSTDPWHRATDRDPNTEQAGIDRFYLSGLTSKLPAMLPLGLLYDTPENMAALLRYVRAHHYPVSEIEMGEEPEGQLIHPNDYGALYTQFGRMARNIDPALKLGGPGFAALAKDEDEDPGTFSERQWTELFLNYLRAHRSIDLFDFFSFEWYPFDDVCAPPGPQLLQQPALMRAALRPFTKHILPKGTPVYITEYGYSAYGGGAEVTIEGALMYADILGQFLALGGRKSFLYGLEPTYLEQVNGCSWGNNMLMGMGENGIEYRTAAYTAVRLMTRTWAVGNGPLEVYPVSSPDRRLTAYALLRPDHRWSILIINKNPNTTLLTALRVHDAVKGTRGALSGSVKVDQYGKDQYHWQPAGQEGHPDKELPPVEIRYKALPQVISLPPYSITVVTPAD